MEHFNGYLPLALVAYNAGLSSAHNLFSRTKKRPTEVFVIGLRPKIVRYYVQQILDMTYAYDFLYGKGDLTEICKFNVPDRLVPFTVKLSVQ